MEVFIDKVKEVLQSVLPITILVIILHFTMAPLPGIEFPRFLFGALLIVLGLAIFLFGVDIGITPIGKYLGKEIARSKRKMSSLDCISRNWSRIDSSFYSRK